MANRATAVVARLRALLGSDLAGVRNSLLALSVSVAAAVVAGLVLASAEDDLLRYPGLFALIPGAVALKGSIFGGLGNRLSTTIQTGTFTLTRRADTPVGQNVLAAVVLSLFLSLILAFLAKAVAVAFGIEDSIPLADYIVVSVVSGVLASVVVLAITLGLAAASVRWGWDLDDVTAPLVTAAGDVVSIPAILLVTPLLAQGVTTFTIAVASALISLAAVAVAYRTGLPVMIRILRESVPALIIATLLSLVGGVILEKRAEAFFSFEVLFVLLPGFLGAAGALGGILSSRLSSKLHLGLVEPAPIPPLEARRDFGAVFSMAIPVFLLVGIVAQVVGSAAGYSSPGVGRILVAVVLAGVVATVLVSIVAYYGTVTAQRMRLDPDTYGIPIVTSSLDLVGAFALILAIVAVGIA